MPFPDLPPRRSRADLNSWFGIQFSGWIEARKRRRRRGKDFDDGGVPVGPDKPKNLSGGAAAALEFDE
jgi:hypothetical protein